MNGAALRRVWEKLPVVTYSATVTTTPPTVDDVPPGYMDSAQGSDYLGITKTAKRAVYVCGQSVAESFSHCGFARTEKRKMC